MPTKLKSKKIVFNADGLRAARILAGMTQAELAEKIGIQHTAIHFWETGIYVPRPKRVKQLAKVLKVSTRDLHTAEAEKGELNK